jgi:hypothetical protein
LRRSRCINEGDRLELALRVLYLFGVIFAHMFAKNSSARNGREMHLQIIALLHNTAAIAALASFASVACIAADSSVSPEVMDARLVVARYEQLVPPQRADILSAAGSAYRDLRR